MARRHLLSGTQIVTGKSSIERVSVGCSLSYLVYIFVLQEEMMQASFHFPLHRYLAAFVCQAVTKMGISLNEVLPSRPDILPLLMIHPLRVQVS